MTLKRALAIWRVILAAGLDVDLLDVDDDGEGLITATMWGTGRKLCFEQSATNGRDAAVAPPGPSEPGWNWEVFNVDESVWRAGGHGWAASDEALSKVLRDHLSPGWPSSATTGRGDVGTIGNTETGVTWVTWARGSGVPWPTIAAVAEQVAGVPVKFQRSQVVDDDDVPDESRACVAIWCRMPARPA
jgi:hypothetical protein